MKVPRGFEPRSLDSESRMLTITPREQVSTYIRVGLCARGELQLSGACTVRNVDHAPTRNLCMEIKQSSGHHKCSNPFRQTKPVSVSDPKMWQVRIELTTLGL